MSQREVAHFFSAGEAGYLELGVSSGGLSVHGCVRPCGPVDGARAREERARRESARERERGERERGCKEVLRRNARLGGTMLVSEAQCSPRRRNNPESVPEQIRKDPSDGPT